MNRLLTNNGCIREAGELGLLSFVLYPHREDRLPYLILMLQPLILQCFLWTSNTAAMSASYCSKRYICFVWSLCILGRVFLQNQREVLEKNMWCFPEIGTFFWTFNFLCTNRKYKAQKVLKSMQFFLLTQNYTIYTQSAAILCKSCQLDFPRLFTFSQGRICFRKE